MVESPATSGMLTLGTLFHNRYQVERRLRSGGMGAVYEVVDRKTARRRALKIMLPDTVSDPGLRTRFEHEATITAQVDSEHLVEVFDAGIDDATGIPFIAMELLKGEELGQLLTRRKQLPSAEIVSLLHQASQALDRTHALGIVHRDLKPENLFITYRDDGAPRLRILDFGIAKLLAQSSGAKTTGVVGTPLYMAPEQALGEAGIGPAADLYALGHIAFTLLVGEPFWKDAARQAPSPVVLLAQVARGSAQPASQRASTLDVTVPPAFDEWFARATAHSPRDRFETASELVEALADALAVPLSGEPARRSRSSEATRSALTPAFSTTHVPTTHAAVSSDRRATPRLTVALVLTALAVIAVAVAVGQSGKWFASSPPVAASVEGAARTSGSEETRTTASAPPAPPSSLAAASAVPSSAPAPESLPTAAKWPKPTALAPPRPPSRPEATTARPPREPVTKIDEPPVDAVSHSGDETKPQSESDTPPSDPSDIF